MNKTLEFVLRKYGLNLDPSRKNPIEIPNTNRESLAELFNELGFKLGAEVGTERGLYAEVLCKKIPGLGLHCVDAWTAYKGYRDHVTQSKLDEIFADAQKRLKGYNVAFRKGYSMEQVQNIDDSSLDFVYIDANHEFKQTVDDITEWAKKVKPGGIVAGHDYIRRKNPEYLMHVIEAVEGYTRSWNIYPYFVLGSKHPKEGEIRDSTRSFFWVKD